MLFGKIFTFFCFIKKTIVYISLIFISTLITSAYGRSVYHQSKDEVLVTNRQSVHTKPSEGYTRLNEERSHLLSLHHHAERFSHEREIGNERMGLTDRVVLAHWHEIYRFTS